MEPVEQIITSKFIPLLVDDVNVSNSKRLVYSSTTKVGGLGINIIDEEYRIQYRVSSATSKRDHAPGAKPQWNQWGDIQSRV